MSGKTGKNSEASGADGEIVTGFVQLMLSVLTGKSCDVSATEASGEQQTAEGQKDKTAKQICTEFPGTAMKGMMSDGIIPDPADEKNYVSDEATAGSGVARAAIAGAFSLSLIGSSDTAVTGKAATVSAAAKLGETHSFPQTGNSDRTVPGKAANFGSTVSEAAKSGIPHSFPQIGNSDTAVTGKAANSGSTVSETAKSGIPLLFPQTENSDTTVTGKAANFVSTVSEAAKSGIPHSFPQIGNSDATVTGKAANFRSTVSEAAKPGMPHSFPQTGSSDTAVVSVKENPVLVGSNLTNMNFTAETIMAETSGQENPNPNANEPLSENTEAVPNGGKAALYGRIFTVGAERPAASQEIGLRFKGADEKENKFGISLSKSESFEPVRKEQNPASGLEKIKSELGEKSYTEKEASAESGIKTKDTADSGTIPFKESVFDLRQPAVEKARPDSVIKGIQKDIVSQLSNTIKAEAQKGTDSSFKLKLKPEGLGEVTVEMKVESGKLGIVIRTELSSTKDLINGGLHALRTELISKNERSDLQLSSLTVEHGTSRFDTASSGGQFMNYGEASQGKSQSYAGSGVNSYEYELNQYEKAPVSIARYKLGLIDYLA